MGDIRQVSASSTYGARGVAKVSLLGRTGLKNPDFRLWHAILRTTTNFFGQRTGLTDIKTVRGAKKTAIVRRIACQSRKSGFFRSVRPRNEVFASPRAPHMLLADTYRISSVDTRYKARFVVCPSRARGPALWRQRRFRERRAQ